MLVDANLLLYAEDKLSPHHEPARTWWDARFPAPGRFAYAGR
jgi:predicted nucleic acid-binding protein